MKQCQSVIRRNSVSRFGLRASARDALVGVHASTCCALRDSLQAGHQRRSRSLGFLCALAFFAPNPAPAAEFVVTNTAGINSAMAQAQPGDVVIMTDGTWTNANILFKGNGTAGQPITLRAQTPGRVLLTGQSRLRIAGNHLVVDGLRFQDGYYTGSDVIQFRETTSSPASNCRLINCAIVDYNPPDLTADNKWVSLYGVSNRVENCYFKGKENAGATLVVWVSSSQPNDHVIARNFFGPRSPLGANGAETIRVGTSDVSLSNSRTLVESNYFLACNGEIEIISSKSCENVYRHNTFDGCEGALTLRHGDRCIVEGNFFLGRGLPLTGGVRIIGEDHKVFNNYFTDLMGTGGRSAMTFSLGVTDSPLNGYFQVKNAVVAFNTLVNCRSNFLIGNPANVGTTNATLPPLDCVIANNIVRGTRSPLVDLREPAPINLLWEGNILNGAATGLPPHPGIATTNPQLVLALDGLWRPDQNSPALGAAEGIYPFVTDDIDGQIRAEAKDIGCDQVSELPVVRRPLGPGDVGPVWMRSAGRIQSAVRSGETVELVWDALPGLRYQVESSTDLIQWTETGEPLTGSSGPLMWSGAAAPAAAYYRLALLP